jgi:hypothetical protein
MAAEIQRELEDIKVRYAEERREKMIDLALAAFRRRWIVST